jgi:hypothetical protein
METAYSFERSVIFYQPTRPNIAEVLGFQYIFILEAFITIKMLGFNLLKPTGHLMHQQFNIQQLYVLPTMYL